MFKKATKILGVSIMTLSLAVTNLVSSPSEAKAYTSNTKLDNRVIFQSFSLFQPYENNMYSVLSKKGDFLNELGITDVWMPPPYRSFGAARYMEGYAIADRYDLGEFEQGLNNSKATKYGTSDQLKSMINSLHGKGLKIQVDLVPNQMMGLTGREAVKVARVDESGKPFTNTFTTGKKTEINGNMYLAYTKGGGQGQAKYGYIKEWNKNYFNGTSVQNQGLNRIMTDEQGKPYRYYGPNSEKNYLPLWLGEAAKANKINTIDSYLSVDGWFAAKDASTSDKYWKPMLIHYSQDKGYLTYMSKNGYASVDDIINGDNGDISKKTEAYINSQPGYGYGSEEKAYQNDNSGIDIQDQFQFLNEDGTALNPINRTFSNDNEFLLGLDIANSNPIVQKEQTNWMNWLINSYKFDGFRIDAASHYDKQILFDINEVMKKNFGKDLNNHLSYIESYSSSQEQFEKENNYPQLTMDWALYYTMQNALGQQNQSLSTLATNSTVNRNGYSKYNVTPNWSFTNNHDQEKNRVNSIMLDLYGIKTNTKYFDGVPQSFESKYDKATEKKALDIYNDDLLKTDKKYATSNVASQYAFMLTNKDTVPTVYYGDMFKTDASYMTEKTPYYDSITKLLKVRKAFAYGEQTVTSYDSGKVSENQKDIIASIRYGKDRNTGVATIIGNNPETDTTIEIDMGKSHANQIFTDASGFHTEKLVSDKNGIFKVNVKGSKNPHVKGYLGVWVPNKTSIKMSAEKLDLYQGKKSRLNATLVNSVYKAKSIKYTTSDAKKVTVDKNGMIYAGKNTGNATISVVITTDDNVTYRSLLPVRIKSNDVSLNISSLVLKKEKSASITIKSATDSITLANYYTSNPKIALVSKSGVIKGRQNGKATIKAVFKLKNGYTVTKNIAVKVVK